MKKKRDFDEFLKQLEEVIEGVLDEIEDSEKRQIFIDVSINLCPFLGSSPMDLDTRQEGKTPVDILETENNIHAVIGLPGMEKKNIKLSCTGSVLEITASNAEKTMKEKIELPARVNKTGMKTAYKNGILEVVLIKRKARNSCR